MIIFQAYEHLKAGLPFSSQLATLLIENEPHILPHQWSSLACLLAEKKEIDACEFLHWITQRFPEIALFLDWKTEGQSSDDALSSFLFRLSNKEELGCELIDWWVDGVVGQKISLSYISFCLMTILLRGLNSSDLGFLTQAFVASGKIYDYRSPETKLIRRYPTGALSEKTALILPSMIAAMRHEFPVKTCFLVARSLSFTGGTWDKLSSIPGFKFPKPGQETLETLERCGVAMTVTHHDVNPADKILYQLRSASGTVESDDLLISSIASKQLCFPVDHLLLDVRFGKGAFLPDYAHAEHAAQRMISLLKARGLHTTALFTDTLEPNGSSVGNALEVVEAIAFLKGSSDVWNPQGFATQREIICKMFAGLFFESFPERSFEEWNAYGQKILSNGQAYASFWSILREHSVSEQIIQEMQKDSWKVLLDGTQTIPIVSDQTGLIKEINQKNLGLFVNFVLGGAGSLFVRPFNSKAGIRLNKLTGEFISEGEILCWIITDEPIKAKDFDLKKYFTIV